MSLLDAYLCLCLSAHMHKKDRDIRRTINRIIVRLPEKDALRFLPYLMSKDIRRAVLKSLSSF